MIIDEFKKLIQIKIQLGVEQEYDLGAYLRRRYASLLGDGRYSNNNVQIRSELEC